jgi:hypothetical protein
MYKISLNIGYDTTYGQSGILTRFPICVGVSSMSNFSSYIRRSCFVLADWAIENHVPKGSIVLYTHVEREYTDVDGEWIWENDFAIKCKNIREYIPILDMSDDEIKARIKADDREGKIEDIIK